MEVGVADVVTGAHEDQQKGEQILQHAVVHGFGPPQLLRPCPAHHLCQILHKHLLQIDDWSSAGEGVGKGGGGEGGTGLS